MDAIKQKLLSSLENCGSVPDAPADRFWEYRHGVYLIKMRPGKAEGEGRSPGQSLVLKPLKLGAVKAFLVGELLAAGQKYAAILPVLIKHPGGRNYLWFRGNRYLLTGMIKGREADYHRQADLQAAIGAMKNFHHFTRHLMDSGQDRWAFLRINLPSEWRKRLREMEICREMAVRGYVCRGGINDEWRRRYLSYWPEFYEQALEVVGALENLMANTPPDSENGGEVICYHDWAYHNVIIKGRRAFLIDFDDIIVDRPVHDRANLIGRYLRLNSWLPTSMFQIMAEFDRFYPWRAGELEWLWIYLAFPFDFWMLGRQYFIEKQPWSMKYYQDQWNRKIACRIQRRKVLEMLRTPFTLHTSKYGGV